MFLCFKLAPIVCSALVNSTLLSSWLTIGASLKHKNTQPLYNFNRENPQNSEPKNGPRKGLDFIALPESDLTTFLRLSIIRNDPFGDFKSSRICGKFILSAESGFITRTRAPISLTLTSPLTSLIWKKYTVLYQLFKTF